MTKTLILILTFLPLTLFGQDLKCCETKKDVEIHLSGIWKLEDSNPEFLYSCKKEKETKTKIEIFYKYTFENGQGHLTEMIKTEKDGEFQTIDDHPFVNIIEYEQGFKLKFTDLSGESISELKDLNSNKMILVTNGKEVEFIKVLE